MNHRTLRTLLPLLLASIFSVAGQSPISVGGGSSPLAGGFGPPGGNVPFDNSRLNMTMLSKDAEKDLSPLENPAISVSKLDMKAPGKARHEYEKGVLALSRKTYPEAADHLKTAISIYPDFVAAHNALGSTFLGLNKNQEARDEFAKAVALDDHLPISHLNLGCAEMALKNFGAAESETQKAANIAPLDVQVQSALAYAQLMNHNYPAAVATAQQVHNKKHKDASIVHYYAAAAHDSMNHSKDAQQELETLLREDPKSPAADQARQLLAQMKAGPIKTVAAVESASFTEVETAPTALAPGQLPPQMQKLIQEAKEKQQIAEAEAMCPGCDTAESPDTVAAANSPSAARPNALSRSATGWTLRSTVDEVAVLFAATNHGGTVADLTRADVKVRDGHQPPASITGFLSESELPLRLGIVIDTSESITSRFLFEQKAAINFLDKVVTDKKDLAFVVGFANSILMVQDFTADQTQLAHGIGQLAPAGGTALWDAVTFGAQKLIDRVEEKPVARILVVISDGEDNSSSTSIKEAIEAAERGEVIVYTVSTRDNRDLATRFTITPYSENLVVGDHALKALAEGTGGAAFLPGSLGSLNHSLTDLQQVIRSRYLISYKPALFNPDGQFHPVDITATKGGHKLRVYARKGYYAKLDSPTGGGTY